MMCVHYCVLRHYLHVSTGEYMHKYVIVLLCEVGQQGVKIRGLQCTEAENRIRQR